MRIPEFAASGGERLIDTGTIKLTYEQFGRTTDPVVLLIMGLGTQMIAWPEAFCQRIAAEGYRVIRFDNRDIGLSQKFGHLGRPSILMGAIMARLSMRFVSPYTLSDMADDTVSLLDALNIECAHVVGASMGGMIAQHLCANFPERASSLTSIMSSSGDPTLPGPSSEIRRHMLKNPPEDENGFVQHVSRTYQLIGSPGYPTSDEDLAERVLRSYRRAYYPEGSVRQLAAIVADGSRVNMLKTIRTPTLVIHGTQDPLLPLACGEDTTRHIPDSRFTSIDGMGHDLAPGLISILSDLLLSHIRAPT